MKRKIDVIFHLILICIVAVGARSEAGEVRRDWEFQGIHGSLKVSATSFSSASGEQTTRLSISPTIRGTWSVLEESVAIDSVLDDFPKKGFEIRSLDSISLRLNEKEAIDRLAAQAAKSRTWRSEVRTTNPARFYPSVISFLNTCQAYKEWNDVFAKRDLALHVVSVEKVDLKLFSKLGATCPPKANCAKLFVPSDALVRIKVEKVAKSRVSNK